MIKNNKGFLLSEALVVSTILMTALILLYAQYATTYVKINVTKRYNTSEAIHLGNGLIDFFTLPSSFDDIVTQVGTNDYLIINATTINGINIKTIYSLNYAVILKEGFFKNGDVASSPIDATMKSYIDFLKKKDVMDHQSGGYIVVFKNHSLNYGYGLFGGNS